MNPRVHMFRLSNEIIGRYLTNPSALIVCELYQPDDGMVVADLKGVRRYKYDICLGWLCMICMFVQKEGTP